ncbi:hypothetical protein IL306_004435 [Fusarium sp. DS 682]|nr:hypothetical protein IL306_004435 [Fusarium sp. DS 682]
MNEHQRAAKDVGGGLRPNNNPSRSTPANRMSLSEYPASREIRETLTATDPNQPTERQWMDLRRVVLLRAEKAQEVKEKKILLKRNRALEAENDGLIEGLKKLETQNAREKRERERLENENLRLESRVLHERDLVERLKRTLEHNNLL